jgi:hypothetical protein
LRCSPRGSPCRSRSESAEASPDAGLRGLQLASSETSKQLMIPANHHPLMGFITKRPSTVQHRAVYSPPSLPRTFGVPAPTEHVPFHPRGFSPPRRFTPARCAQVCCTLHPVVGFGTFRVSRAELPRRSSSPGSAYTLRSFPLVGSRTASPRPLPPCCSRQAVALAPSSAPSTSSSHEKLEPFSHHFSFAPKC